MKKLIQVLKAFTTRRLVVIFDKVDFTYTGLSWKKIFNWFVAELSYVFKSSKVFAYPTHLQLEPVCGCNLRCPMCYIVTHDLTPGFLKLDHFRKLIDEVCEYVLFLHFWGWGEPFLHKDIYDMIRYAKQRGIKVITSTNGHFFENEEKADQLIDSGLDVLIFALDGADRETYEKYRKKGDFERVIRGLKLLVKRKADRGTSFPRINLRMVVTKENEDQIPEMMNLAKDLGVDIFSLKTLSRHDQDSSWEDSLPSDQSYLRFEYGTDGQPIRKKNTCKKMWNHVTVFQDGNVFPCDYHVNDTTSMGNAFDGEGSSFKRVWFGDNFRKFRSRFTSGDLTGLRCESCDLNYVSTDHYVSHAFFLKNGITLDDEGAHRIREE